MFWLACVFQGRYEQNKNPLTFQQSCICIVDAQVPLFSEPMFDGSISPSQVILCHGTFKVGDGLGFQHIALSHAAAS
jgi:hypothetical protein